MAEPLIEQYGITQVRLLLRTARNGLAISQSIPFLMDFSEGSVISLTSEKKAMCGHWLPNTERPVSKDLRFNEAT